MVKHIVMWKFKDLAEGNDKNTNILLAKEMLHKLTDKIDCIKMLEFGININPVNTYDAVLFTEFDDFAALEKYQSHPEHLKVSDFIGKVRESRACTDYEI